MKRILSVLLIAVIVITALTAVSCAEKTPEYHVSFTDSKSSKLIIDTQTVKDGEKATEPAHEEHEGYTFDGWFVKVGFDDVSFDFTQEIHENKAVFAKYSEISKENN